VNPRKNASLNKQLSYYRGTARRLKSVRSAAPGIWLCQPKFKRFTWLNHAPFRDALPFTG